MGANRQRAAPPRTVRRLGAGMLCDGCRLVLHRTMLLQRAGKFGSRLPEASQHNSCFLCSACSSSWNARRHHRGAQAAPTHFASAFAAVESACAPCLHSSPLGPSAGARQRPVPVQSGIIMCARWFRANAEVPVAQHLRNCPSQFASMCRLPGPPKLCTACRAASAIETAIAL